MNSDFGYKSDASIDSTIHTTVYSYAVQKEQEEISTPSLRQVQDKRVVKCPSECSLVPKIRRNNIRTECPTIFCLTISQKVRSPRTRFVRPPKNAWSHQLVAHGLGLNREIDSPKTFQLSFHRTASEPLLVTILMLPIVFRSYSTTFSEAPVVSSIQTMRDWHLIEPP